MTITPLWEHTAAELASAVRSREVSAEDVVRSFLDRIEKTNPHLNALVEVRPDEALDQARQADRAVAAGDPLGPLHGVPVSVKINTDQRGHVSTHGVEAFKAAPPAEADTACVAALRNAGAILLGRSNAPAFSLRWFTTNAPHGRTLNPWDSSRTPGGSSGGASSSLAAGMTPIAHGNDIGGSIRQPAACCGVVGLRPTAGLVSEWSGMPQMDFPLSSQYMSVEGPLGRTVSDVRLALEVMSAPELRSPAGIPALPSRSFPAPGRVAVLRRIGTVSNAPAVERALDDAVAKLADAGYDIEEIDELPLVEEAARLWQLLLFEDLRATMLPDVQAVGDDEIRTAMGHYYAAVAKEWTERPSLETYIKGWARRGTLIGQFQEFLGDGRILLTPVTAEPAFEQGADLVSAERTAELMRAVWPLTAVPVLGFPAISVPTLIADGLPTSVQLIGARFDEGGILAAAEAIEARTERIAPALDL
ncbi:amidase [Streptomyces adustus]|uniref:amidase n=1 Tax=Streptomyces adustus TaxID=1609272 RepID=UPI0037166CB6